MCSSGVRMLAFCLFLAVLWLLSVRPGGSDPALPPLPDADGPVVIPVRDDPAAPPRALTLHLRYPHAAGQAGRRENVTAATGLMLDLHNWGGTTFEGAPNPETLAERLNVIAIGVQYYQSGDRDGPENHTPYDFGYIQAIDALRALAYVTESLRAAHLPFDATRIYGAGGSGGGNVIQMANKLAPGTFACIVDLSGMASLTDDIAYNLPGGSSLNARYSRDPSSPAYLSKAMQEIRDLGNRKHLALQAKRGSGCKVVVIHGDDDTSCLAADKRRVVEAMRVAGLDVEAHFLGKPDVDGTLVKNSGHSLGDRTALLLHFAGKYLAPERARRLPKPLRFSARDEMKYPVEGGAYVVSYPQGVPTLAFRPSHP